MSEEQPPRGPLRWWQDAKAHPGASAALVACIVLGALLAGFWMPESISLPRRVIGGGLMGGLSWLLVMVGRLIDG